jgi:hypothetical protein
MKDLEKLAVGIGTAIGNVAAHETGHQLKVPHMECTTCHELYQLDHANTGSYTGNPRKTWGTDGICFLENYLIPGSCGTKQGP